PPPSRSRLGQGFFCVASLPLSVGASKGATHLTYLHIRGRRTNSGRVRISGAKNSAAAILPACLLAGDTCSLEEIPHIRDVQVLLDMMEALGVTWRRIGDRLEIDPSDGGDGVVPYEPAKRLRASILFLGPLLARLGKARVPLPGGCDIGSRPIDLHLKGLREMGATLDIDRGYVVATADELRGAEIYLDFPSVGATENLMMAASLARGS